MIICCFLDRTIIVANDQYIYYCIIIKLNRPNGIHNSKTRKILHDQSKLKIFVKLFAIAYGRRIDSTLVPTCCTYALL